MYDPKDKKGSLNARSERRQRRIMEKVQTFFTGSDPAQLLAPVVQKAAHSIARSSQKRTGIFP